MILTASLMHFSSAVYSSFLACLKTNMETNNSVVCWNLTRKSHLKLKVSKNNRGTYRIYLCGCTHAFIESFDFHN